MGRFDPGLVDMLLVDGASSENRWCPHLDGHLFAQRPVCCDARTDAQVRDEVGRWAMARRRPGRGRGPARCDRALGAVSMGVRTGAFTRKQEEALFGRGEELAFLAELGVLCRYRLAPVDGVPGQLPYVYVVRRAALEPFLSAYPEELAAPVWRHLPRATSSIRHGLKVTEVLLRLLEASYIPARPATVLQVHAPNRVWETRWDVVVAGSTDVLVRVVSDPDDLRRVCVQALAVAAQRDVRVLVVVSSDQRRLVDEARRRLRNLTGWQMRLGYTTALEDPVDSRCVATTDSAWKRQMDFGHAAVGCVQVVAWDDLFPQKGLVAHDLLGKGVFSAADPAMRGLWRRDPIRDEECAWWPAAWVPGGSSWPDRS